MVYFSPATREITAKIVYYGPGMCGKTTNLQKVHELMRPQMKSDLISVATETDRTIYFDFLPLKLGKIAGFDFVVRSFTVPGQPYYAETRKMVLQGADGVVFVADSQRYMLDQNKDSLMDLKRNLKLNGLDYRTIPLVMQWNKRDLPDCMSGDDLNAALNDRGVPTFDASAVTGKGVVETLKAVTLQVFRHVRDGGLTQGTATGRPKTGAQARPKTSGQSRPSAAPRKTPAPIQSPLQAPLPATPKKAPKTQPFTSMRSGTTPEPVKHPAATSPQALGGLVNKVVANAETGAPPMPSKDEIGLQEFQNLAVLLHKLTERVAQLEQELTRLGQDHQDLKRIVGRKLSS